jgi:hypothetical protein
MTDLFDRYQRAKRRSMELLRSGSGESAHTTWMNDCVPTMMNDYGKGQQEAIAACLLFGVQI